MLGWSAFAGAVVLAAVWAMLEIQIEGPDGWAAKLPTWKIQRHTLLNWFYGGRPLTGYHLWAFTFVLGFFHFPFLSGLPWSFRAELQVVGLYCVFWVVEDALWFLLNPHFGFRKFQPAHIWWHRRWFLGLPQDYWLLTALGGCLFFLPLF